jgi:hypothetical protein
MTFRIINNKQFEILQSIDNSLGNRISDEIVRFEDQVGILRNSNELFGYSYLESLIIDNEKVNWRSNSYKEKWFRYHYNLLSILKLHQRDSKIEEVLQDENYDNQLILAC